jgi:hypothetical protein
MLLERGAAEITIHPHAHPWDTDPDIGQDSRPGFYTLILSKLDAGGSQLN